MSESASFWSFIQSVLSGETAPGPTHLWLIVLCIAGSAAVALGIIVESWPPKSCKAKVAMALVIGGVLCEGGFTVVLFTYDEAISHRQESTIEAQQSEIIALRKNALSRSIDVMSFAAVLSAAPPAKIEGSAVILSGEFLNHRLAR